MKKQFIAVYRLHKPGNLETTYPKLYKALKELNVVRHITTSAWIIGGAEGATAEMVFNHLKPMMEANDELAVFQLNGNNRLELEPTDVNWLVGHGITNLVPSV